MTTAITRAPDGRFLITFETKKKTRRWAYVFGEDGPEIFEHSCAENGEPHAIPDWVEAGADHAWASLSRINRLLPEDETKAPRDAFHARVEFGVRMTKAALQYQNPDARRAARAEVQSLRRVAQAPATSPALAEAALFGAVKISLLLRALEASNAPGPQAGGTPETIDKRNADPMRPLIEANKLGQRGVDALKEARMVFDELQRGYQAEAANPERMSLGGVSGGGVNRYDPAPAYTPEVEQAIRRFHAWAVALKDRPWWSDPGKTGLNGATLDQLQRNANASTWWDIVNGAVFQFDPFCVVERRLKVPDGTAATVCCWALESFWDLTSIQKRTMKQRGARCA